MSRARNKAQPTLVRYAAKNTHSRSVKGGRFATSKRTRGIWPLASSRLGRGSGTTGHSGPATSLDDTHWSRRSSAVPCKFSIRASSPRSDPSRGRSWRRDPASPVLGAARRNARGATRADVHSGRSRRQLRKLDASLDFLLGYDDSGSWMTFGLNIALPR